MKYTMFSVIINDVRSIWNVGSIFRTADGVGVDMIYLTGYTPGPDTHAEKINKTALGAEKTMTWKRYKRLGNLLRNLRQQQVNIIALEQSEQSVDFQKFKPKWPLALIVGSEVGGLPSRILKLCDDSIEIPMRGQKESLNVAVAFGIAAYELTHK